MPPYHLRAMRTTDLPAVNRILSKAFTAARIEEGYKKTRVPPCHLSFLEMYLASFPSGNLVLEHKHGVVGYAFGRLWGEVGWIGPVSVIPAHQGKRLGHRLIQASVQALQNAGARVIGLETMPRNYRNIGFYSKIGFVPQQLSVDLSATLPFGPGESLPPDYEARFYSAARGAGQQALGANVNALARQLDPCLDLKNEIELVCKYEYGDALCICNRGEVLACIVAHTKSYSEDEPRRYLKVTNMLIDSRLISSMDSILALLFFWANQNNLDTVIIRTPTRYVRAYEVLISAGFRVFHSELRMTLAGYHEAADPRQFYLSRWQ